MAATLDLSATPWTHIDASGDCWAWTGATVKGYGSVRVGGRAGRSYYAHRVIWERLVAPIAAGLTLDHLCRNSACVNPDHLEPVTNRVNTLRGYGTSAARARQTHCIRGHEFTAANTRLRQDGWRNCRTCDYLRKTASLPERPSTWPRR